MLASAPKKPLAVHSLLPHKIHFASELKANTEIGGFREQASLTVYQRRQNVLDISEEPLGLCCRQVHSKVPREKSYSALIHWSYFTYA